MRTVARQRKNPQTNAKKRATIPRGIAMKQPRSERLNTTISRMMPAPTPLAETGASAGGGKGGGGAACSARRTPAAATTVSDADVESWCPPWPHCIHTIRPIPPTRNKMIAHSDTFIHVARLCIWRMRRLELLSD